MLSEESGFTLVELLVATLIGGLVMASAVTVLTGAQRRSDAVQRRTEATLQARSGMDAAVRSLRAQTCLPVAGGGFRTPLVSASASSVTFYLDFSGGRNAPQRRTLTLTGPNASPPNSLVESIWYDPNSASATPDLRRTLASNVVPGVSEAGTTGFLSYYAFDTTQNPPTATRVLTPDATGSLSDAQEASVVRIGLDLVAQPRGTQDGTRVTSLDSSVFVRLADPDGAVTPVCSP